MTGRPLTTDVLADALGCFWNAALGAQQQGMTQVSCMAEGIQAVSVRLTEAPTGITPAPSDPDAVAMAKCREVLATECQYGHSDLGDLLVAYLKGKISLAAFLWNCDVTWLGYKAPPPREG